MAKHGILIIGSGKIGVACASLLAQSEDYKAYLCDLHKPQSLPEVPGNAIEFLTADIKNPQTIINFIKENKIEGVISCLPFNLTYEVAKIAHECGIHYFDPTEDVAITDQVCKLAQKSSGTFVPQCGLAPGFISIAANSLMQGFDKVENVKMRVGALTQNISNSLSYGLTWSIDGLVNEYLHPCRVIEDGMAKTLPAMGGLESLVVENFIYEAFHTSGGAGSLVDTYKDKVQNLDYKTIRYPGHCKKMNFLLQDLKLRNKPELVKDILRDVLSHTEKDKVIVYVSVEGEKNGMMWENNYTNTLLPVTIHGRTYTAIQMTTATGICTLVDMVMHEKKFKGIVKQEDVKLDELLQNRFGKYYAHTANMGGCQWEV